MGNIGSLEGTSAQGRGNIRSEGCEAVRDIPTLLEKDLGNFVTWQVGLHPTYPPYLSALAIQITRLCSSHKLFSKGLPDQVIVAESESTRDAWSSVHICRP